MNLKQLLYFLVFLISISCNTNDDVNETLLSPPEFLINVFPSFDTAEINFSISDGENNQNLLFDIYVNNELIVTNLSETIYTLENLIVNTTYQLEVIAKNTNDETSVNTSFQTFNPDDYDFFVDKFTYLNTSYQYNYNNLNQLITRVLEGENEDNSSYIYNSQGNLLREGTTDLTSGTQSRYTYENGIITDFRVNIYLDSYNFDFTSPENYTIVYCQDNMVGCDIFNYQVQLQKTDSIIISYERINLDTDELLGKMQFSYQNGNVVQIIDELNDDEWTFEYDDKNNYGIKYGHLTKPGPDNHFTMSTLQYEFFYIPEFVNYSNKNNVMKVYKNGQLHQEYEYEYNLYGYPSKIFINGNPEPRELTYIFKHK